MVLETCFEVFFFILIRLNSKWWNHQVKFHNHNPLPFCNQKGAVKTYLLTQNLILFKICVSSLLYPFLC